MVRYMPCTQTDDRAGVVLVGSSCETVYQESVDAVNAEMTRRELLSTESGQLLVVASFDTLRQGSCSQIYEEFNEVSTQHQHSTHGTSLAHCLNG